MNKNKSNLPEFLPLRDFVKTFPIVVSLYDDKDNLVREEKMDYGKPEDRIWLGKISYYAWNNGLCVETRKDD